MSGEGILPNCLADRWAADADDTREYAPGDHVSWSRQPMAPGAIHYVTLTQLGELCADFLPPLEQEPSVND